MKDRTKLTDADKKLLAKEARDLAAERKLLNRKWAKEILLVLEKGDKCCCDIREGLIQNGKTITEDMANKTLKHLLKFDFIKKIKSPTSHEQKDFTLTPYGREALVLIHKLMDFGSRYNKRMDIKNAEK